MNDNTFSNTVEALFKGMNGFISTKTVVGDAIKVDSETLNPEMLEELNQGIKANSKEELNLIIEDIES